MKPLKQLGEKIKHKMKASNGMSLGEILVAVLIMLLSTSVLVTTVNLGLQHYIDSVCAAEANVLSSTLQSLMTTELAYTSDIRVANASADESAVEQFQSPNYSQEDTLSTFFVPGGGYGKVMIGSDDSSFKLLGDGSYPHSLEVSIKKFTYNQNTHLFTVEFSIRRKSTEYLDQTFQVINVNKTKAT